MARGFGGTVSGVTLSAFRGIFIIRLLHDSLLNNADGGARAVLALSGALLIETSVTAEKPNLLRNIAVASSACDGRDQQVGNEALASLASAPSTRHDRP